MYIEITIFMDRKYNQKVYMDLYYAIIEDDFEKFKEILKENPNYNINYINNNSNRNIINDLFNDKLNIEKVKFIFDNYADVIDLNQFQNKKNIMFLFMKNNYNKEIITYVLSKINMEEYKEILSNLK